MAKLEPDPVIARAREVARVLGRQLARLDRKLEAMQGDLEAAEQAPELRRSGEALLSYLNQVSARSASARLPDPGDPERTLEIALDPRLSPQANAARYFKRAAKAERGLEGIPDRIATVRRQRDGVRAARERLDAALATNGAGNAADPDPEAREALDQRTRDGLAALPPAVRRSLEPKAPAGRPSGRREPQAPTARHQPRRLRTTEGWDVLIGRTNEGNDFLTHKLARPEDYWFHVQGAPGSHVVLRRGRGKNEPSKLTLQEVGSWAAFYSQARTAGKVPVIYTLKKYVRKPRKSPPGLAVCEREKSLMVRPAEPPRSALADAESGEGETD
jgi:predicted ribosome quality control (RQC) complex YloA/Tae2 family protein